MNEEYYISLIGEAFDGYSETTLNDKTAYIKHVSIKDQRYLHKYYERYKTLMSIKYIDEVYMYQTEEELHELIKFFKPDIRILGEDYIGKRFTGDDLPPKVIYTTRCHEWSTTRLKDLITIQTIKQNPEIVQRLDEDHLV